MEAQNDNEHNHQKSFYMNIYNLEKERIKYLIKVYLRTRLQKIQNFYEYIRKYDQHNLLSIEEKEFHKKYLFNKL